ncbi:MAG: ferrochelatase [Steroidobacteraceae bacterium]|nr:ferrochelatase [Steroidobacteraceae bacterium]MBP7014375.1 ferrochelatase [Steroidobacteraceae bacterium]
MTFLGTPDFVHGSRPRIGVLLVNLGTPADPSPRSVRKYLAEFLSDPRVIEAPRLLWWLVLHGVILRTRPQRSAHAYQKIWTPEGSPLLVESRKLVAGLAARLQQRLGDDVMVDLAMTYGQPSIKSVLARFREQNLQRLLVLPLYPQYSSTTTGSIFEFVTRELSQWRWMPELRFVNQYWDRESYLRGVADSIAQHWQAHGRKHLLFSFHSIPQRYFLAGDPYHCFCLGTARGVARRLGLAEDEWSLGFQSRFGREEWLQPYVDRMLQDYAKSGPKRVTVVCPGFATDCLETLEEISMQNRDLFLGQGGEAFDYVPCLNSSAAHVDVMEDVVLQHAGGWPGLGTDRPDDAALAAQRERALARGAQR